MTTMAAAFRPVIDRLLAEHEAAAKKAVRVAKTTGAKGQLRAAAKWNHAAFERQQAVMVLRQTARRLTKGGGR